MEQPTLLIADFKSAGGAKRVFRLLFDLLVEETSQLSVLVNRQAVVESELDYWHEKGVDVYFFPDSFNKRNRLSRVLRLYHIHEYLFLCRFKQYSRSVASIERPYFLLIGALIWRKQFTYIQHTYPQGQPSWMTKLFKPFRRIFYRKLKKTGYQFVTGSKVSAEILQRQLGLDSRHLPDQVIPNCLSREVGPQAKREKIVLTSGQVVSWKNPELWLQVAINVIAQHPDYRFIWAGDGPLLNEIQSQIPEEFKGNIQFVGYQQNIQTWQSRSSIYFQPSKIENHSLAVVEAMAQGLPCVVSNRGGLPEMIDDGVSGFVLDLDAVVMADGLSQIISNDPLRVKMGQASSEKFEREFTYEIWRTRMSKLIFGQQA